MVAVEKRKEFLTENAARSLFPALSRPSHLCQKAFFFKGGKGGGITRTKIQSEHLVYIMYRDITLRKLY